jgi:hypothetical protein
MAINVLTEPPAAVGDALAGADAETIAEVVGHHRDRIAELEAIAREIIKAHRDVEVGLEVPKYIYKMAVAAIEGTGSQA